MKTDWNKLRDEVHQNSVEHGWWEGTPSDNHFLCLVISELMEAVEADRKDYRTNESLLPHFMDPDKYNREGAFQDYFERYIKDTVEDELADAVIRLLDLAGQHQFNIHVYERIRYSDINLENAFTENIFYIVRDVINANQVECNEFGINHVINLIVRFCEIIEINLVKHIDLKMKYNKTRAYKHGKKY